MPKISKKRVKITRLDTGKTSTGIYDRHELAEETGINLYTLIYNFYSGNKQRHKKKMWYPLLIEVEDL